MAAESSISSQFVSDVKEWRRLVDQKAAVMQDMKKGQQRIKALKESIVAYMDSNKIDTFAVQGERVKLFSSKLRQVLNEDSLKDLISKYYEEEEGTQDGQKSVKLAQFILENRGTTFKPTIRRLKMNAGSVGGEDEEEGGPSEDEAEEEVSQRAQSKRRRRTRKHNADQEEYDTDSNAAESRLRL
jgi:hypothetical protein